MKKSQTNPHNKRKVAVVVGLLIVVLGAVSLAKSETLQGFLNLRNFNFQRINNGLDTVGGSGIYNYLSKFTSMVASPVSSIVVSAVPSVVTSKVPSKVVSVVTSQGGPSLVASTVTSLVASTVTSPVASVVTSAVASAVPIPVLAAKGMILKALPMLNKEALQAAARADYINNPGKYHLNDSQKLREILKNYARTDYGNNRAKYRMSEVQKQRVLNMFKHKR